MSNRNTLIGVVQNIRIVEEEQSYRAAGTVNAPSLIFTKTRQVTYTTTRWENASYEAAYEKLTALKANPAMKDKSLDITDPDNKTYSVTATEKVTESWSDWSS